MDVLAALAHRGFFTRASALQHGYDDRTLASLRRHGVITRIRHGAYALCEHWAKCSPEERHLLTGAAVLESLQGRAVLSHVSAAVAHGMSTWDADLSTVHVTRLDDGSGRIEAGVRHHVGSISDHVTARGLPVVPPARAAVEAAMTLKNERALVVLDSCLHLELASPGELWRAFKTTERWPGHLSLHVPMRMADGKSQSPGESRGRWFFWSRGLPAPVLQFPVLGEDGTLIGISDWAWPEHGLFGEFDGKQKYSRLLAPGQDPSDVVFAEKLREDAMRRATGWTMERVVWSDFDRPTALEARFRRALGVRAG